MHCADIAFTMQHKPVEYTSCWVRDDCFRVAWPCQFQVVCLDFVGSGYPTQMHFPGDFSVKAIFHQDL